jgi:predicted dehydrogenase
MRTPVNVGVVGLGGWGEAMMRVLDELPGANLAWICDEGIDDGIALTRLAPGARFATRVDALLQDDELDAVVLAAAQADAELVRRALDAGKHVLIQPPLAARSEIADELVRHAERCNRRLMAAHLTRFHAGARKLKGLIQDGRLGDIYYLFASRTRLEPARGDSGILRGLGAEAVSTLLWLVADEPVEVSALGGCYGAPGAVDVAFCRLRFATGIEALIRLSQLEALETREVTAVGSRAMAVFDEVDRRRPVVLYQRGDPTMAADPAAAGEALPGDAVAPHVPGERPLYSLCEHFLAATLRPAERWPGGREAAAVVAVLESLERSLARAGQAEPIGDTPAPARNDQAQVVSLPLPRGRAG